MQNLQAAAATPVAPAANSKTPAADAPADNTAPPWAAALQAALTQQAKDLAPATPQNPAIKDDAAQADGTALGTDDKKQAAIDAAAATPAAGLPLQLLATLPPPPPAAAPAPSAQPATDALATTPGATSRTRDAAALPGAGNAQADDAAQPRAIDARDSAKTQHDAPEAAVDADAVARALENAAARESNGREATAAPQVPLTLAHAVPAAAAPATSHAAQLQVNAPVGSAAWGAEVGQKVVWMIGEKQHVAELRVNPPELGPLDIKLTVSDHQTTAVFTSPHSAVRDAVESALPRLREVLAESGVTLGNASVTSDSPRDGSAFAQPQGQAQRGNLSATAQDTAAGPVQAGAMRTIRHNGLVDLFA